MAHIESILHVQQPLEDVFSFLNRRESHLKFIPRMTELHQTSQGIFGQIGTRLSGMLNYFGIRIPVRYEITEVEPDQRLAMKGQMGPIRFKDGYVLKRNGKGTEIQFWLDLLPSGGMKVFSPFMGLIGRIHAWETLRNLKRELAKKEIASRRLAMTDKHGN
jgi:hypothetical protein